MKAEILAVGTELLLGDIVNSNAAWISKRLADLGVDVYHHVTVGDNPKRIHQVVQQAIARADILIFTGGLGPTQDDLTVATLADYFGAPLISDPESEETIKRFFIARGIQHSPSNMKQALRPQDAQAIVNPVGTAPGLLWDVSEKTGKTTLMLCFPGVPRELYAMWETGANAIRAKQAQLGETPQKIVATSLHFFGIGESKLGEILGDLMNNANPTAAPYVGRSDVRVRLAAKAETTEKAEALIAPVKKEIIHRLQPFYFGEGEEIAIEHVVAELLLEKGLTVATAESCTGGLVSARLTDVPGSSNYTHLNVVTYSNTQKQQILGVCQTTLDTHGAVSEETATEMARGIQKLSGCDIGISLTGIAGPEGGTDEKPVGLVYIGLCGLNGEDVTVKKVMVNRNYPRTEIKFWFSQYALQYLRQYLTGTLMEGQPLPPSPSVAAGK